MYFTRLLFCALLLLLLLMVMHSSRAEQPTLISFHHVRLELDKFHFCSSSNVHTQFFSSSMFFIYSIIFCPRVTVFVCVFRFFFDLRYIVGMLYTYYMYSVWMSVRSMGAVYLYVQILFSWIFFSMRTTGNDFHSFIFF